MAVISKEQMDSVVREAVKEAAAQGDGGFVIGGVIGDGEAFAFTTVKA